MLKVHSTIKKQQKKYESYSLVEVMLSAVLLVTIITAAVSGIVSALQSSSTGGNRARATALAQECLEAVRSLRDIHGYSYIEAMGTGPYAVTQVGGQWFLDDNIPGDIGIFRRQVGASAVNADLDVTEITCTVTWTQNGQRDGSVTLQTYLTNWMELTVPLASWANPAVDSSMYLFSNVDNAYRVVASQNGQKAFVSRDANIGNLPYGLNEVHSIITTNTSSPTYGGSFDLPNMASNGQQVQALTMNGDTLYVLSKNNTNEFRTLNALNPASMTSVGTVNLPDATTSSPSSMSMYSVGSTVYIVRSDSSVDELIVVNAPAAASPTIAGSFNTSSSAVVGPNTMTDIWVSGNYAYTSTSHNSKELLVYDISNPSAISKVGDLNIVGGSNSADATCIVGAGTRLFIGRDNGEFAVIDISSPTSPSIMTTPTFSVGVKINDCDVNSSGTLVFLALNSPTGTNTFTVLNTTTPTAPTVMGTYSLTRAIFDINYNETIDRVFAATGVDQAEFQILKPN